MIIDFIIRKYSFIYKLQGETGSKDCLNALATLSNVLFTMVKVMAPFTPFLSELMYQNLRHLSHEEEKSVHFLMMPEPKYALRLKHYIILFNL